MRRVIHCIKTSEEPKGRVVVHRAFQGEHELSEDCWCRPEIIDADDLRSGEEHEREMNDDPVN